VDQHWLNTGTSTDTDRLQYSYDRDSNRTQRTNAVNTLFSESYGYDSFNQLTSFMRNTHSQTWGLDNVGNWKSFTNDQTGPPSETRTQNAQNQITNLTGTGVGTPGYDANGNTLTDEWGHGYSFDAWNRLAQVTLSGSTLTYSYDVLGRRVVENNSLLVARDLYYSKDWQVLEERSLGVTQLQYVWSPVYVDALGGFNLARVDALNSSGSPTRSGLRNLAVTGNLLATLTPGALSFFGLPAGTPGGVQLPQDALASVAAQNNVVAGTIQATKRVNSSSRRNLSANRAKAGKISLGTNHVSSWGDPGFTIIPSHFEFTLPNTSTPPMPLLNIPSGIPLDLARKAGSGSVKRSK
jgi:YD repeat-containing protein